MIHPLKPPFMGDLPLSCLTSGEEYIMVWWFQIIHNIWFRLQPGYVSVICTRVCNMYLCMCDYVCQCLYVSRSASKQVVRQESKEARNQGNK